jgi:integrase
VTVAGLANRFLDAKRREVERGEITHMHWVGLRRTCRLLVQVLGRERAADDLGPEDFGRLRASLEGKSANTVQWYIQHIRSLFNYGTREGLLEKSPTYGHEFRPVSAKALRRQKAQNGALLLDPKDIHRLLEATNPTLRAMLLLGINCGFGQGDCATLTFSALDLEGGWVSHPRPKTGVARRCSLWSETVAAICEAIAGRPEPQKPEYADLVFLARRGYPYVRVVGDVKSDRVAGMMTHLLKRLGIHRRGLGFYTLRRTFETVAEESLDFPAVASIMGHVVGDQTAVYRQRISDERLRAVAECVRKWLFGDAENS